MKIRISIDNLIKIVRTGGKVQTGVDVYNDKGILLLDKDVLVDKVKTLEIIQKNGINSVPVNTSLHGGLWDGNDNIINIGADGWIDLEFPDDKSMEEPVVETPETYAGVPDLAANEMETRLQEIKAVKYLAAQKFIKAKETVKKVLTDIKNTGGEFDYDEVQSNVSDLVDFLIVKDNPFSFLTKEIFSYDDYLYNHCVQVCTIGTAIVNRFNIHFSKVVDDLLKNSTSDINNPFEQISSEHNNTFTCYYPEDLYDISLGFFLHDMGKILVDDKIMNKVSRLTVQEFDEIKKHSYEYGVQIIEKNNLKNSAIRNIIKYHHAPLYEGEKYCYPVEKSHTKIPLYTKICKLADIYDAMTSRRCYKEAVNPINVVTYLFKRYAKKDHLLQYILHSFVKSIGIHPPGSIVYLINGQMAYVLESEGPLVLPFTDEQRNTLKSKPDPIKLDAPGIDWAKKVDNRKSVKMPKDVYALLPSFIKKIIA